MWSAPSFGGYALAVHSHIHRYPRQSCLLSRKLKVKSFSISLLPKDQQSSCFWTFSSTRWTHGQIRNWFGTSEWTIECSKTVRSSTGRCNTVKRYLTPWKLSLPRRCIPGITDSKQGCIWSTWTGRGKTSRPEFCSRSSGSIPIYGFDRRKIHQER